MMKADAEEAKRRRALHEKVHANRKVQVITPAEKKENPYHLRRPSGLMQLDIDTGGGLAAGSINVISGPDNAGKTYLLNNYVKMHQRIYGDAASVLLCVVEELPNHIHMRRIGVEVAVPDSTIKVIDKSREIVGLPPLTKEEVKKLKNQVGTIDILAGGTAEQLFDILEDCYEQRAYKLIGIDSISAMLPDAEKDLATLEDNPMQAAAARLLTRFVTRVQHIASASSFSNGETNKTTIIATSQVRANRKRSEAPGHMQKYIKEFVATGAYSMKHAKFIDISIWNDGKERSTEGGKVVIGKNIKWELIKGKGGDNVHDYTTGEFPFRYATINDTTEHLVQTGINYGIILKEGKKGPLTILDSVLGTPLTNPTDGKPLEGINGHEELRKIMDADYDTDEKIRMHILNAAKVTGCVYR